MKYTIYDDFENGLVKFMRNKHYELYLFNSEITLNKFLVLYNNKIQDGINEYNKDLIGNRKGIWIKFKVK